MVTSLRYHLNSQNFLVKNKHQFDICIKLLTLISERPLWKKKQGLLSLWDHAKFCFFGEKENMLKNSWPNFNLISKVHQA